MAGCVRHKQLIYIPKLTCGIYFHFFQIKSLSNGQLFSERFCSKIDIYNWIVSPYVYSFLFIDGRYIMQ